MTRKTRAQIDEAKHIKECNAGSFRPATKPPAHDRGTEGLEWIGPNTYKMKDKEDE